MAEEVKAKRLAHHADERSETSRPYTDELAQSEQVKSLELRKTRIKPSLGAADSTIQDESIFDDVGDKVKNFGHGVRHGIGDHIEKHLHDLDQDFGSDLTDKAQDFGQALDNDFDDVVDETAEILDWMFPNRGYGDRDKTTKLDAPDSNEKKRKSQSSKVDDARGPGATGMPDSEQEFGSGHRLTDERDSSSKKKHRATDLENSDHQDKPSSSGNEEPEREEHELTKREIARNRYLQADPPRLQDEYCAAGGGALGADGLPPGAMTWGDATYWKMGTGALQLGISGEIDQTALDSSGGINQQKWWFFFHAKAQAWKQINIALGTKFDENTNFTFLPAITYTITNVTCSTRIDVPVLLVAENKPGENPTFKIDPGAGSTFEICGQIVYALGFINVYVWSGTFIIDRAMYEIGDFYIKEGAAYHFGGLAPDTTPVAGVSVNEEELRYFNGNKGQKAYWAQVIDQSTIYLQGGSADTSETGLIVINCHADLRVENASTLGGHMVVGWDGNCITLLAKVTLLPSAKIFASADVDFTNIGFDGSGTFVVAGLRLDRNTNSFVTSHVHVGNGATIGNLTIGYNAFYDLGIGGAPNVLKNDQVNPQPNFGGTILFDGTIMLTGVFAIGGGDGVDGVATIAASARLLAGGDAALIDVANQNGVLEIGDNAVLTVGISMEGGTVKCGVSDVLDNVTVNGGVFNVADAAQIKNLILNGGTFNAINAASANLSFSIESITQTSGVFQALINDNPFGIIVTGAISVSGGRFEVAVLNCSGLISITGSGSANFGESCSLGELTVDSSGDVSLWNVVSKLTLEEHATGTTTVHGTLISDHHITITVKGGKLAFVDNDKTFFKLDVLGGSVDASTVNADIQSLTMSGGTADFKSLSVGDGLVVSGGSLRASTVAFDKTLQISGSGSVDFEGGTLNSIIIESTGSNKIGASFNALTLGAMDVGTTTVTASNLTTIDVEGGALVIAAELATIDTLKSGGGKISVAGDLTARVLGLAGGNADFAKLTVTEQFAVSGGTLTAKSVISNGELDISQSGSVQIAAGNLHVVVVDSVADSSFGAKIGALTLGVNQLGTVTLTGNEVGFLTINAGVVDVLGQTVISKGAALLGGNLVIKNILALCTNDFTSTEKASLSLDGGHLNVMPNVTVTLNATLIVTPKGGAIYLYDGATSHLTLASNIEIDGRLSLIGDPRYNHVGAVTIAHDITGNDGSIQVFAGAICDVTASKLDVAMQVEYGKLTLNGQQPVWIKTLDVDGGTLTATTDVSTTTLHMTKGLATFDRLVVEKGLEIGGGNLVIAMVTCATGMFSISGAGLVQVNAGNLHEVMFRGSEASKLGADIDILTLAADAKGNLTLSGGTIDVLKGDGGTLDISGQVTVTDSLEFAGGALVITSTLNDAARVTTFSAASRVTLDGGTINFTHTGQITFECPLHIGAGGGNIQIVSGASVKCLNGLTLDGVLNLTGAGTIVIAGNVTGAGLGDVINVGTGTTLIIEADATIAPAINLAAGAHLVFSEGASTSVTVNISDEAAKAGCTICFDDAVSMADLTHIKVNLKNFANGVKLDLRGLKFAGVRIEKAYYLGGKIHVVYELVDARLGTAGLHELVFDGVSGPTLYDNEILTVEDDGSGGTDIETCFLEGTLIETPEGMRCIEALIPGDTVWTYEGDARVESPVRWVGRGEVTCRPNMPDDLAGYPVRIARNAISPGVPVEDVYVTSEHCLFLDGGLIPARMLVNGGSIAYARGVKQYRFYHIATASHAIISASRLKAETYLDTGNRERFSAGFGVVDLRPEMGAKPAAPYKLSSKEVEPIHRRLTQTELHLYRYAMQPLSQRLPTQTTHESDVHVLLPDGRALHPIGRRGATVIFNLPAGVRTLFIRSRASRPCDAIGPWVDDRRKLGVLIGAITVVSARSVVTFTEHLKGSVPGWHDETGCDCRWTDGCGLLSLYEAILQSDATLGVAYVGLYLEMRAQGPYIIGESKCGDATVEADEVDPQSGCA